uniref:Uncharacterized protein n=1 Tax=Rhodosorus marinus TaxID=101924 RepID=A0A7S0G5J7_9RHOD|mmetsp:Transcript_21259/g.30893  ORF Transcript_21259/g.30893 Transcript_21259/m.30893 type:complete len:320 (+) Transcript_21259:422-1381(+)
MGWQKMSLAFVVAVVGSLCLVHGEEFVDTCASFPLPPPTDNISARKCLWGESYCKELTLEELNGKTPKLCVRNENPKDQEPTGCLRLSLRNVEPAMVKSTKIGIHSDCASIPKKNKDKYQKRRSLGKLGKTIAATRICFDEIPAAITCCETEQCLVFEAVLEIEGVDTKVAIQDDTCSSDEGCPYSIGCPNLITQAFFSGLWLGTESNDLLILTEDEYNVHQILLYEGYDVVIGSNDVEVIRNSSYGKAGNALFLKGGDDSVEMADGEDKIYLGKGDDSVLSVPDGIQDKIFGGEGMDTLRGGYDDDDILNSIALSGEI